MEGQDGATIPPAQTAAMGTHLPMTGGGEQSGVVSEGPTLTDLMNMMQTMQETIMMHSHRVSVLRIFTNQRCVGPDATPTSTHPL